MDIILNGRRHTIEPHTTIADLLRRLNVQPRLVAVERNEELVPRSRHAECALQPGDRLEIVTLVGGG